ncbi:RHS repeat-associated core domain-containing protein [Stenotrophomonas sp. PD6]|uniref:RHS repeat-associated core domain-containing protein n=1 Tax=Stenotrophomonas sp. PD6 TaxID=3368612 RepID=UPI003BA38A96
MLRSAPSTLHRYAVALLVSLSVTSVAYAEEVTKVWKVGGIDQPFRTEQQAQQAIEAVVGTGSEQDEPFKWHVADTKMSSQEVTYFYRMRPMELIKTEWKYRFVNHDYDSEEAMLQAIRDRYASAAGCPATQITPGEWRVDSTGPDGSASLISASHRTLQYFIANGNCVGYGANSNVYQVRDVRCPNPGMMAWRQDIQACDLNPYYESLASTVMIYTTSPITNQCLVGNPCEPTTGNKSQPELDLEYSWLRFTRYFQSMTSTPGGGFGSNWTHSHNIRLAIGNNSMGLIEADGTHLAFYSVMGGYEAMDESGDRLVRSGTGWRLSRETEVLTFNANGQIQSRVGEDGGQLAYLYDTQGRLLSITHHTGRSLSFQYEAASDSHLISSLSLNGTRVASYEYTEDGQVMAMNDGDGNRRSYHYEDPRFPRYLTGVTVEDGSRYSWFGYDEQGRVVCSRHSPDCGSADVGVDGVRLSYGPEGTTVKDALGRETTYGLSRAAESGYPRKVTTVSDHEGAESRYYYEGSPDFYRPLTQRVDRKGVITNYGAAMGVDEDAGGRELRVRYVEESMGEREQRYTFISRDVVSNRLVRVTAGMRDTRIVRNARFQPISVTAVDMSNGAKRATSYAYCEAADVAAGGDCPVLGLLKQIDGPRTDVSDVVTFRYYNAPASCFNPDDLGTCWYLKGDLKSVTNALGHSVEILQYDRAGRPLSVKNANGSKSSYGYNARGLVTLAQNIGVATPSRDVSQMLYYPTGKLKRQYRAGIGFSDYFYDSAQRLSGYREAGRTLQFVLDDAGNRIRDEVPSEYSLSRTYDSLGQLTAIMDAEGNGTSFKYDVNGNLSSATDARGRVALHEYDSLNRRVRTTQDADGVGALIEFGYNVYDEIDYIADPKGLATGYAYNGFGDVIKEVSPDSGNTTFTVDAAGNLKTRTDARGVTSTYYYDALNRLTRIAYPDPSMDVGYSYDVAPPVCTSTERTATGYLSSVRHAHGSTEYCRDGYGQITRKVQTIDGVSSTVRYAYTWGGRLERMTYPDGSEVDYAWSQAGISSVGVTRPGQPRQVVVGSVGYASMGAITSWGYGSFGLDGTFSRSLDQNYRPKKLTSPSFGGLSLAFTYDPVGAIVEVKSGDGENALTKYDYDSLGRLVRTKDGQTNVPIESYTYDLTGNRTSLTTAAGTDLYQYERSSHRLKSVAGEERQYDAAGNTLSIGGRQFSYSDANRMSNVSYGGMPAESYAYNHLGERVLRMPVGKAAETSMYDESGRWLGSYSATGQPLQQVIWMGDYPVAVISSPSPGVPEIARVEPDHLGTPRVVIDPARGVPIWEWSMASEAFGNQMPNTDPDRDGVKFELALRFPGQQATDASGMYYNYQRDYEPSVGRYSQRDPIGLAGGISGYAYASGRPTTKFDPSGLIDVWVWMPLPYEGGVPSYGKLHSSFGHVSATSLGTDYSFGPGGNYISNDYVSKQLELRSGIKHTLNLRPEVERSVAACLSRPRESYSALTNNCATPIQECLRENGLRMPPYNLILPESLNHFMWWMFDTSEVHKRSVE